MAYQKLTVEVGMEGTDQSLQPVNDLPELKCISTRGRIIAKLSAPGCIKVTSCCTSYEILSLISMMHEKYMS